MKKSKAMVWYPATQTPVENGYYLVAVLYADSEAVETTVKTARFIDGRWVGFSDGLRLSPLHTTSRLTHEPRPRPGFFMLEKPAVYGSKSKNRNSPLAG